MGPPTFLPIHAVGIYDSSLGFTTVDFVASSYIPTLAALINKPHLTSLSEVQFLAIIDLSTPSGNEELHHIKRLYRSLPIVILDGIFCACLPPEEAPRMLTRTSL